MAEKITKAFISDPKLEELIYQYRREHPSLPNYSEAVRELLFAALEAKGYPRQ